MEKEKGNDNIIKVRLPFRIIGLLISFGCIFVLWDILVLDWAPAGRVPTLAQKIYNSITCLVAILLLLPPCILGKVPSLYLRLFRADDIIYLKNIEKLFKEFSVRSIAFTLMLALTVSLAVYWNYY